MIFLTETDAKKQNAKDYHISGYTTYVQLCGETDQSVRIMALTKDNCGVNFSIRTELMAETFPSIWLEIHDKHKSKTLLGGFYRQWTNDGIRSVPNQVEEMEEFCRQINEACTPNCKMIITGDANLCAQKWKLADFDKKSIANPLLECLEQNGLQINNVGLTYQADHASASGDVAHSALDHVYSTETVEKSVQVRKISNSATDHLPVVTAYNLDLNKVRYKQSLTKRSFKNFTKENWNQSLANQDWTGLEDCDGVDEMVKIFDDNISAALNVVAPAKTFTIRSNHKFGLSDSTKDLMKKRDRTRNAIKNASKQEKAVLIQQYRSIRNRVTCQIRKETVDYNNKRIEEANSEKELWKVANEVIKPKTEMEWKIKNNNGDTVTDELEVAEEFNNFFVNKIEQLKNDIDTTLIEDPLVRLKEKMAGLNTNNKLEFKPITQKKMTEHLKKLNKKKSSGLDGLSQENLLLGSNNLLGPLTTIVNRSIVEGVFPKEWKQAAVIPVLKKGSAESLSNYRPVSCLPAASKVLEIVVCSQLSIYLESNDLLPKNQHGFRPGRSTMTAWQEIQLDWAIKSEQKQVTGILLWDLSAAFDTLDCDGLCAKLELFGVQSRSVNWIRSFLTGRSQCVRIGSRISSPKLISTGVPQGGVLSPLIFVLFVSDLQDWLKHSTAPTYADDTTTGTSTDTIEETLSRMEEDAGLLLKYMASNGLVANADKTSFLVLNCKKSEETMKLRIGEDWVERETSAKLLGVTFDDSQQWKSHIHGKGGLLSSLNSRLYIVRRMKNHLSKKAILKIVDGLFTSRVRYGLQLFGNVRTKSAETECADLKAIQLVQNKLLRHLNGTKISDKISTDSLLKKFGMCSVNQLNAQAKLLEIWKALNVPKYPLELKKQSTNHLGVATRADTKERLCDIGKTTIAKKSCISDAIRLWNLAPEKIHLCKSLYQAKSEIKNYIKSLPI